MKNKVPFAVAMLLAVATALSACASDEDSARVAQALKEGATRPTDDAEGVCCPVQIGGCAKLGGYRADGDCSTRSACDNMCEQRIIDGEHGCKVLTYKTPAVRTTYAAPESCEDPRFNGGSQLPDAGAADSGK